MIRGLLSSLLLLAAGYWLGAHQRPNTTPTTQPIDHQAEEIEELTERLRWLETTHCGDIAEKAIEDGSKNTRRSAPTAGAQ